MRVVTALFMLLVVGFSPVVTASEAQLREFFANIDTLQATFEQKIVDETGQTLEFSRGQVYLSRPGKFRWDYNNDLGGGTGQQIVADGTSIFMFDPDLDQVTQRELGDALGQVPSLLLVQQGGDLEKFFAITDIGNTDGLSWVALDPKDEDAAYQQLMLGFQGAELNTILLLDGLGNETRLVLSEVKSNLDLAPSLFEFSVPDGADLLRG